MRNRREWDDDRTRLDMDPLREPVPVAADPLAERDVVESDVRRVRTVRTVNGAINLVCGLFAVVLALHIVLVLLDANPNNGFASFVDDFAGAVSLGLRGLFTPDSVKLQVLLNDGMAALGWLLIAAALTYTIRQFALPGPRYGRRRYVIE
jgi:hypothetical protein